ncbi:hypothetical protein BDR06DRAFT_158143 [Suillus hirtellus]|nr:hypothetical protein BDR06DRAFT_158143 [Suillus hirtellus]
MLFALPVIPEWGIFMFGASILSTALCVVGTVPQWSPDRQYSGSCLVFGSICCRLMITMRPTCQRSTICSALLNPM